MFVVEDVRLAVLFCVITMLGWGSWANTQKLAGRDRWPFPLYYWDYAIGVFVTGIAVMLTLGAAGEAGMGALANLAGASGSAMGRAVVSGVLFNIANILLVVAIDRAGMSVAFPVGVGLALVVGTVASYLQTPKGNAVLLFMGVGGVLAAMIVSAIAHGRMRRPGHETSGGVGYAIVAGLLMGFFYPQLMLSLSPEFNTAPIQPGLLTPYTALFFFGVGLLLSNFLVNTVFMRSAKVTYGEYFAGSPRLHSLGILGGAIWMIALSLNVIASGVAGPAISYALGQGATLVAAIWGVMVWREFQDAPPGVTPLIWTMFVGYTAGLLLIGLATL